MRTTSPASAMMRLTNRRVGRDRHVEHDDVARCRFSDAVGQAIDHQPVLIGQGRRHAVALDAGQLDGESHRQRDASRGDKCISRHGLRQQPRATAGRRAAASEGARRMARGDRGPVAPTGRPTADGVLVQSDCRPTGLDRQDQPQANHERTRRSRSAAPRAARGDPGGAGARRPAVPARSRRLEAPAPAPPAATAPASTPGCASWWRGGRAICCWWPARRRPSASTAASCCSAGRPLDGDDHRGRGPRRAAAARRRAVSRRRHRRRVLPPRQRRPLPHQPAPRARPGRRGDPRAAGRGAAAGVAAPAARRRGAVAPARAAWC